ncbi:hypothetical protein CPB86DRAFT_815432 [Serendipita vermifera]|nr:hypothetical protein CPB86DRAFT_815432 [Serendipita vermifera]
MTAHIRLSLYLMDQWIPVISIPREDFTKYTTRPLKWLRYLGSTIYGREGILKRGPDNAEIEDYTTEDVNSLFSEYFYYSTSPPRLLDMDMIDQSTTSSDMMTPETACSSFQDEIIARDQLCVSTGMIVPFCGVIHIVPYKKYIEALTGLRANSESDVIRDINDVRNGMLLMTALQIMLRRGYVGVLKTPNFAMSPEDVPRVQGYTLFRAGHIPPHLPARWTLQYFGEDITVSHLQESIGIHQNSDIFPPEVLTEWPTDLIFDLLYGYMILHEWGCKEAMELIHRINLDHYHHASPHAEPQSFEKGGQGNNEDLMELDNEAHFSTTNSLYDTADGLIKLWQGLDLRREPEGPCREFVCPQEVQERVSNWLMAQ